MVCPKCGAKYEVDATLIPPSGRDVQCSNCGETWFQPFEQADVAPEATTQVAPKRTKVEEPPVEAEVPVVEPAIVAPEVAEEIATEAEAPTASEPRTTAPELPPEEDEDVDEPPLDPAKEIEFPTPPHIADSVREMLKSESEREVEARAEDAAGSDNWGKRRQSPLRDKMNQARVSSGALPDDTAMASAVSGLGAATRPMPTDMGKPRSQRLPDVEEINSSLQSAQDQFGAGLAEDEDAPVRKRAGFGKGFFFVIFLVFVAVVVYALADLIAQQLPQIKPALDSYVEWVDGLRAWLDAQVRSFTGKDA